VILNWIEGSIFLIVFAPKTLVKTMLRDSVKQMYELRHTANEFAMCLCWDFALHFVEKTNLIFWCFFQNFNFYYLAVLMERTIYCKFWDLQVIVKSCPILLNIPLLFFTTPCELVTCYTRILRGFSLRPEGSEIKWYTFVLFGSNYEHWEFGV